MRKVYYEQPYLKELDVEVFEKRTEKGKVEVITDSTIFYPECGGQPGDRGLLGEYRVFDTRKADNGDSVLIMEGDCDSLKVGDKLKLKLDWPYRYHFMRMHTMQHMISGLLYSMKAIGTVAVHLGEDYLTIETEKEEISLQDILEIEEEANNRIRQNLLVSYEEMSHKDAEQVGLRRSIKVEGNVRLVRIENTDVIACGGVHVASTKEGLYVSYIKSEKIRGHVRLFFQSGEKAVESIRENNRIIQSLCNQYSCKEWEILEKAEKEKEQLAEERTARRKAEQVVAKMQILQSQDGEVAAFENKGQTTIEAFQAAVLDFEDLALCIVDKTEEKVRWLIALKGRFEKLDFNLFRKELLPLLEARGGGKTPIFQGVAMKSDSSSLSAFLSKFTFLIQNLLK